MQNAFKKGALLHYYLNLAAGIAVETLLLTCCLPWMILCLMCLQWWLGFVSPTTPRAGKRFLLLWVLWWPRGTLGRALLTSRRLEYIFVVMVTNGCRGNVCIPFFSCAAFFLLQSQIRPGSLPLCRFLLRLAQSFLGTPLLPLMSCCLRVKWWHVSNSLPLTFFTFSAWARAPLDSSCRLYVKLIQNNWTWWDGCYTHSGHWCCWSYTRITWYFWCSCMQNNRISFKSLSLPNLWWCVPVGACQEVPVSTCVEHKSISDQLVPQRDALTSSATTCNLQMYWGYHH